MVKLKEWMMIVELHRQGLSASAIAQRTGHDRKTVRKYIRCGLAAPKYPPCAATSELIAVVRVAMLAGVPYTVLRDTLLTHPAMAEGLTVLFANEPPLGSNQGTAY